ncbi:MAG: molybdopterin-binding protein [Patulibacter sp.]
MTIPAVLVIAHDVNTPGFDLDIEEYGPEIAARVEAVGGDVLAIELVPLGGELFEERMQHYIDGEVALLLTIGGAGIGPDDIVPELTSIIVERRVPGLEELMRRALADEAPAGSLERGACGIAGGTLVVNLPRELRLIETALASLAPVLPTIHTRLQGREPSPDAGDGSPPGDEYDE